MNWPTLIFGTAYGVIVFLIGLNIGWDRGNRDRRNDR